MVERCDAITQSGRRCKHPPTHWIHTTRERVPRKVCNRHAQPSVRTHISADAPDRTPEYESLGYVRIPVDDEQGYTYLLGFLLEIPWTIEDHRPPYVWIKIEYVL